ncbi:hypothetical protein BAUCODRAFT_287107 [Baudoinia panamericana UAMH 10762]|uniref:nitrilase n=1 Tax=Baudoinia panamericana (strain UAMH 10762) TaxID=717646 RepID=M2LEF2_BAUPA|nr:uncharacterized protein BAUCODRAFT_287107 [Baudoinia panamericana UAMH 10762]EMC92382.1 hypothetical protein BAUCODRAFT_287107 [Baudoinia panamericana UAMH 10762]
MATTNGAQFISIRVAVTQAEPVWLDLQATVEKTCKLITEAAEHGARLIAFPECWVPGYPCWIWLRALDFNLMTRYLKNSLKVDSSEMRRICQCAKDSNIAVILGFSENLNNSLWIAQATISAQGKLLMTRRKLKATHLERTVFGDASGASLHNVVELDLGQESQHTKVGALSCWEHIQPLLKYHTYLQGEEIHVAAWPPLDSHPGGDALWSMSSEGCQSLSQTYAAESAAFVLHCTAVVTDAGVKAMQTDAGFLFNRPGGGSSAVFGPDGRRITEPLPSHEEGIIYADLDMDMSLKAKCFVDSCGHYSRPDLLWLGVDDREKKHKIVSKGDGSQ